MNKKKYIPEDIKKNNFWLFCAIYDMHDVSVSMRKASWKKSCCIILNIQSDQNLYTSRKSFGDIPLVFVVF